MQETGEDGRRNGWRQREGKKFSNQSFAEIQQFVPCMEKSTHLEERERQMCLVSFSGRPSRTKDCCRGRETKWDS